MTVSTGRAEEETTMAEVGSSQVQVTTADGSTGIGVAPSSAAVIKGRLAVDDNWSRFPGFPGFPAPTASSSTGTARVGTAVTHVVLPPASRATDTPAADTPGTAMIVDSTRRGALIAAEGGAGTIAEAGTYPSTRDFPTNTVT